MGETVYQPHHAVVGMRDQAAIVVTATPAGRNGTTAGGPRTAARRPPKELPSHPTEHGAVRYVVVR